MKITWLGQAGLLFETNDKRIVIDPYLSNSVAKIEPKNYRRQPINEKFLSMKPNVIVITHNHADHLDKDTLCYYLHENSNVTVLAPNGSWQEIRKFGGNNNYVLFNNGTTWREKGVAFRAVKAEHSDEYAIGVILSMEGKNYYVTGDTLYNESVFASLPQVKIEALFLPVNGVGNNMNCIDAKAFADRINARFNVPIHIGMFDDMNPEYVQMGNKIVPEIYKEIEL